MLNPVLDFFAGDRDIYSAEDELNKYTKNHDGSTLYRGLPYLKEKN